MGPFTRMLVFLLAGVLGALAVLAGPGDPQADAASAPLEAPSLDDAAPRDYPGLHNVVAYHEGYFSGGVPEGDAGFDTLARFGVKTIISVDGAEPDAARAGSRGMRYIHLPIGYNGFDEARKLALARATRDALRRGPVYIHCHHGKHRSAGAAAAVAVTLGWMSPEAAVARMKVSGTSPNYKGLYSCASGASAIDAAVMDAVPAEFPAVSKPAGFVRIMVEMDEVNDHLKLIEKAGWAAPADHPDLVPAAEAGRMADLFRLALEDERARGAPDEFTAWLRGDAADAQRLEDHLSAGERDTAKLSALYKPVAASCSQCHVKYRD